jgi:hypothetical protein
MEIQPSPSPSPSASIDPKAEAVKGVSGLVWSVERRFERFDISVLDDQLESGWANGREAYRRGREDRSFGGGRGGASVL